MSSPNEFEYRFRVSQDKMKASLKFREDQRPLIRAKVPLSILGLPFQSGVVAGDSKELSLNLSTLFESGPSVKFAYRPNDSWNPFSLIVKTGTGSFGSPISSSMLMSAEFNLAGRGNPSFMLHFKPRFGDFSIKKSQSSVFDKVLKSGSVIVPEEESIEIVDVPVVNPAFATFSGKKIPGFSKDSHAVNAISGFFSGMEVTASTTMPVRSHAAVNFRWGLRVPAELKSSANPTDGFSFQKVPFLVLNKIGIEHVDGGDPKEIMKTSTGLTCPGKSDLGEACFSVKRQMEVLQAENGFLKKAVDDLRQQIVGIKSYSPATFPNSGKYQEMDRNGTKPSGGKVNWRNKDKYISELGGFDGLSAEEAASEELRKALNVASGA